MQCAIARFGGALYGRFPRKRAAEKIVFSKQDEFKFGGVGGVAYANL